MDDPRWLSGGSRPRLPKRTKFTALEVGRHRHRFWGPSRDGRRAHDQAELERCNDARTGMPPGIPEGAMCVQRFDDSLNSAIHITYRISLRSSSMPEPRDPLLKVLSVLCFARTSSIDRNGMGLWQALVSRGQRRAWRRSRARQSNRYDST